MRAWAIVILAALALAAPAAADEAFAPMTFASAFGDKVAAEAGKVTVPEHHGAAGGASITLPVVRFRSTAAKPGPPVIYLAGGPGGSGLESARSGPFSTFMQLRAYGDVVTFDQRGTGGAQPSLMLAGRYDLPADRSLRDPATAARLRQIATEGAVEIKRRGLDLAAYNTAESAEDIESLRRYLGAEKVVIWGHSYGSHLGLAYIKAHPERVAGAVLSGVNDLGARWRLPSDSDAFLQRIDAALKQDPRLSQRLPSFLATVERVMKRLDAQPQRVTVGGKVSYVGREELQALIALQSGDLGFVRSLPALFAAMDNGDFGRVAVALQQVRAQPLGTAMRHAMHLASGVSPARLARIADEAPRTLSGDGINFPYVLADFRDPWGVADLGEGFRAPTPSDVKALFLIGQFDGRTSVREGRETASRFRNGAFAEVAGVSHEIYGYSPALGEAMIAFLREGRRPPAVIPAVATEFRSPDEEALLRELGVALTLGGRKSALAKMEAMASATFGPVFNVSTARQAGEIVFQTLKRPDDAIALLEAADRRWPGDFLVTLYLGRLYRLQGQTDKALAAFERLRAINPLAPGVEADIVALKGG